MPKRVGCVISARFWMSSRSDVWIIQNQIFSQFLHEIEKKINKNRGKYCDSLSFREQADTVHLPGVEERWHTRRRLSVTDGHYSPSATLKTRIAWSWSRYQNVWGVIVWFDFECHSGLTIRSYTVWKCPDTLAAVGLSLTDTFLPVPCLGVVGVAMRCHWHTHTHTLSAN